MEGDGESARNTNPNLESVPNSGVGLLRADKVDENDLLGEATESMKIVEEFIADDKLAKSRKGLDTIEEFIAEKSLSKKSIEIEPVEEIVTEDELAK